MRYSWMLVLVLAINASGCGRLADLLKPKDAGGGEEPAAVQEAPFVFAEKVRITITDPVVANFAELPAEDASQSLDIEWYTPNQTTPGRLRLDLESQEFRSGAPITHLVQGGVSVRIECAKESPSCLRRTITLTYQGPARTQTVQGWVEVATRLNLTAELFPIAHRESPENVRQGLEMLIGPAARRDAGVLSPEARRVRGTGWTARIQNVHGKTLSYGALRLRYENDRIHGFNILWTRDAGSTDEWTLFGTWPLESGATGTWIPNMVSTSLGGGSMNQSNEDAFWRETDRAFQLLYSIGTSYTGQNLSFPFVSFELDRR